MADPPRRAANHRAVRGRAGGGVTPDGGTPDGGTPDGGGMAGGPSDGGTPDAGTPSTASTPAQRQHCLEQADQWKDDARPAATWSARSSATPAIAFA
jgi:hypothetical protein